MKRDDCVHCVELEAKVAELEALDLHRGQVIEQLVTAEEALAALRTKHRAALERLRDQVNAALLLVEAELAEREQKASPVE